MADDKLLLTQLFEKTSKSGNRYFSGRLGKCRVVMLLDREPAEDGTPRWSLFLSQADAAPSNAQTSRPRDTSRQRRADAPASDDAPWPNDAMPEWTP